MYVNPNTDYKLSVASARGGRSTAAPRPRRRRRRGRGRGCGFGRSRGRGCGHGRSPFEVVLPLLK